jgi:hypothetical protein
MSLSREQRRERHEGWERRERRERPALVAAIGVAAALALSGCGSGDAVHPTAEDAGVDVATVLHRSDAAPAEAAAASEAGTTKSGFDGTVGTACTSDLDCQPAGGPGMNTCSTTTFVDPIFPTPVCVLRSCDPGTDGLIHFCDGPDNPQSPGICLPTPSGGTCLPSCFFGADGAAPVGCKGKDTCTYYASGVSTTTGQPVAIGYCFGGCVTDADCPTGSACQTNAGICVASATPPTKPIGSTCTAADNGSNTTPPTCNCFLGPTSTQGFCTQSCIVRSATATCPGGYVCDSLLPAQLTNAADASVTGFTVQNTNLAGLCLPTCGGDAAACPGMSTCSTADTAGQDCTP